MPALQLTVQDSTLLNQWGKFLENYCKQQAVDAALDYPEQRSLAVAFSDIELCEPSLSNYLLIKPAHALRLGAQALHQLDLPGEPKPKLHLRITGLPDSQRIIPRNLRAEHLGKLLAVEGLVKKVTEVRPTVQEAVFECKVCTTQVRILQDDEFLTEPVLCETCDAQRPWRFVEEESRYLDHQKVEIQEAPEGLRGGSQPERLTIHLQDDLVHKVAPGDRVRINGILTTQARRQGSQKRVEFNKVLGGISIEVQQQEFSEVQYTAEEEDAICTLGEDPRIYDRLRASFAP
ncbi:MAG TPA: AAA family ATPase, partial [Candidatus Thermoplasmatota archaeon]|nr:AAA family ATPase [Candidatus Thermoplasmatota archaeon]